MLHLVDRCYYEEPFYFRDAEDIREDISSVKSALREANKKIKALDEARESMKGAVSEMRTVRDKNGDGEEDELSERLSMLFEETESTYNECARLFESLDALKEELDESIWFASGGIL